MVANIRPKAVYTVVDITYDDDPEISMVDVSTEAYTSLDAARRAAKKLAGIPATEVVPNQWECDSGDGKARTIMIRLSTIHQG